MEDNIFEKIFSIKNNNTPEFLDFNNKYYMAELLDQKEITTPLSNQNLKKTIKSQLKITNTIEENNNILKKLKLKILDQVKCLNCLKIITFQSKKL